LSKTAPFHPLFIKKKDPKRCRFERHRTSSSSPGRAGKQGRELLFPCFHRLLSTAISLSKRRRPTLPKAFHVLEKREKMCSSGSFWGDNTVAAPAFLSPILPINTEGESTTRRDEGSREGRGKRTERKEKKKKKRENGLKTKTIKKKNREREKRLQPPRTTSAAACRLQQYSQWLQPPQVSPSLFLFFSFASSHLLALLLSTVHVVCE